MILGEVTKDLTVEDLCPYFAQNDLLSDITSLFDFQMEGNWSF